MPGRARPAAGSYLGNQLLGHRLLHATVGLAGGTLLLSYLLAVAAGHSSAWLPTTADLDRQPPEGTLFSLGLTLTAALLMLLAFVLHRELARRLAVRGAMHNWKVLNNLALLCAVPATICLALLANTPADAYPRFHHLYAAALFSLALLWATLVTAVTSRLGRDDPGRQRLLRWRRWLAAGGYLALVAALLSRLQGAELAAALGKWLVAAALVLFLLTLDDDLRDVPLRQ